MTNKMREIKGTILSISERCDQEADIHIVISYYDAQVIRLGDIKIYQEVKKEEPVKP